MKKFYEAPIAEELYADAANLMALTSAEGDGAGDDVDWNSDLLGDK